jgi:hypothetical protein
MRSINPDESGGAADGAYLDRQTRRQRLPRPRQGELRMTGAGVSPAEYRGSYLGMYANRRHRWQGSSWQVPVGTQSAGMRVSAVPPGSSGSSTSQIDSTRASSNMQIKVKERIGNDSKIKTTQVAWRTVGCLSWPSNVTETPAGATAGGAPNSRLQSGAGCVQRYDFGHAHKRVPSVAGQTAAEARWLTVCWYCPPRHLSCLESSSK